MIRRGQNGDLLDGMIVCEAAHDGEQLLPFGAMITRGSVLTVQVKVAKTEVFGINRKTGKITRKKKPQFEELDIIAQMLRMSHSATYFALHLAFLSFISQ